MLSGKAPNTNFIVFGLTRSGLEPTIYRTRVEHANHYTSDAVDNIYIEREKKRESVVRVVHVVKFVSSCFWFRVVMSAVKNDVRFVSTSICFVWGSCFIYVLCIYLLILVSKTICRLDDV
jgi:hypothetical protein